MRGYENADVILPDGSHAKRRTTLYCQTVCFVSISGVVTVLRELNTTLPQDMDGDLHDDCIIFILVRYFSPHPLAFERDTEYRPICPGPLRLNHCLWKFAKTSRCRGSMCNVNGTQNQDFIRQKHIFGATTYTREKCFEDEKFAYYNILSPRSIKRKVNMTQEYDGYTLGYSDNWIETVTLM